MNKLYKLCEYGVPISIVGKLKDYSIDEIKYKSSELMQNINGITKERMERIVEILNSQEFQNSNGESVYELIEHGISLGQINQLANGNVTIEKLRSTDINSMNMSTQFKRKLMRIDYDSIYGNEGNQCEKNTHKDADFSDLLQKEIKIILDPFEVVSVVELKNKLLERKKYPIDYFLDDVNRLFKNNVIELTPEGIYYRIFTLKEKISEMENDKYRMLIQERLNGATLEAIGKNHDITRERVRQIIAGIIRRLGVVKEDRYRSFFEKYDWEKEAFCKCFNEEHIVYEFLNLKYIKGNLNVEELIESDELSITQRKALESYYNYIEILGEKIRKDKNKILDLLIRKVAQEPILIDDLRNIYNEYLNKYFDEDNYNEESSRNFEAVILRRNNCISGSRKTIRYFETENISEQSLQFLIDALDECEFGEYSMLYFFKEYAELMQELDIRDEYELHNLMRIKGINNSQKNIVYSKMPHIFIGMQDKKEFYEEILKTISPTDIETAANYFYENFGHKIETAMAYISTTFSEYINRGNIEFESKLLPEEYIDKIKERINTKLCTVRNAKEIFKLYLGEDYAEYFNAYNLNLIGYKLKSDFIQSKDINSLEDYIKKYIQQSNVIYKRDIPLYNNLSVYNILTHLEEEFDIVKISEDKYINFSVLSNAGLTKEKLRNYGERLKSHYSAGEFFTLTSIRNLLGENELDKEGFENCFYESLIYRTDKVKKIKLDYNNIFYISSEVKRHELSSKDFIYEIIQSKEAITVKELKEFLEEEYGVYIKSEYLLIEIFRDLDLYYSKTFDKVYIDKMLYFNEVYGEE